MTKYKWSNAGGIRSLKAQAVGEELERIRTRHRGKLRNLDVIEEARDKRSALHKYFDWDDTSAAAKWRLEQAGLLIRSIEVVVEVAKGKARDLRAFVSVKRQGDRSYTSLADAMSDDDLRAQVLSDALRELQSWRERYSNLSELAKLFPAIDRHLKSRRAA